MLSFKLKKQTSKNVGNTTISSVYKHMKIKQAFDMKPISSKLYRKKYHFRIYDYNGNYSKRCEIRFYYRYSREWALNISKNQKLCLSLCCSWKDINIFFNCRKKIVTNQNLILQDPQKYLCCFSEIWCHQAKHLRSFFEMTWKFKAAIV